MNDCHGCFDRISNTVAILVLMSFGLAHTAAKVLFEVLQHAEHRIKTGFGVSKPAYGISFPPLAGTGQGNPAGPVCWTLISSIMIKVMKKRGHYVEMRSALSLSLISIVCFAFVDDTDLPISGKTRTTTGEELQQPFQEALDAWAHLISVTGGELCPKKSWCYIIDFHWTGKNWEYRKKDDIQGDYYLLNKNKQKEALKRLEVSEASETLGVHIAPDGNDRIQREKLRENAKNLQIKFELAIVNRIQLSIHSMPV